MRTKVWINGITGRMGRELEALFEARPAMWQLVGGTGLDLLLDSQTKKSDGDWTRLGSYLSTCDLLIDFSAAAANQQLFAALQSLSFQGKSLLIGTTGLKDEQKKAWQDFASARQLRLLLAPNTSLGVVLTLKVTELLARVLDPLGFDIEVLETHHRAKLDAPSGTAKFLAEGIAQSLGQKTVYGREGKRQEKEIGIAALRGGSVFGEHEVRFLGDHEEIKVSHRALNRTLFAEGALVLASWLLRKGPGAYRLEDVSIEDLLLSVS